MLCSHFICFLPILLKVNWNIYILFECINIIGKGHHNKGCFHWECSKAIWNIGLWGYPLQCIPRCKHLNIQFVNSNIFALILYCIYICNNNSLNWKIFWKKRIINRQTRVSAFRKSKDLAFLIFHYFSLTNSLPKSFQGLQYLFYLFIFLFYKLYSVFLILIY